jgi:hypothetical protein
MSKRAGKTGNRKYYNGHTKGPGGLKCPCCGAVHNAKRVIRRKAKQELREYLLPDVISSIDQNGEYHDDYWADAGDKQ